MRVDPERLSAALRRIRIAVADEKTRAVKVERGAERLTLSCASFDTGQGEEELAAECAEGHASGLNLPHFETMLAGIGGDSIEIHQADARAAMLLRRVVDDGAIGVLVPMAI